MKNDFDPQKTQKTQKKYLGGGIAIFFDNVRLGCVAIVWRFLKMKNFPRNFSVFCVFCE